MSDQRPSHSNDDPLRRHNRELSILNVIAEALNREVDLQRALAVGLAQVADLLDLQTGWVWLLNETTGEPYLAAAQNLPPGLEAPAHMEGSCYCLDTYRDGDLDGAANVNVVTCSRLKNLMAGTAGLLYHASIPLYAHNKPLGVLNVASTDWRELSADDLRLLYTVGDLLSIAIERARLFARSVELGAVEERNRLAREIHDTLAQGLAGITLRLETADALLEADTDPAQTRAAVQHALALARQTLEEGRRSVLDLRASPLEGRTLAEALAALAESANRGGLAVRLETVGAAHPVPSGLQVGLYRIAQEALANVQQHAQATQATLYLENTAAHIRLVVEDNGQGFDPATIPAGHFGLQGISERANLLGGTFTLCTELGEGTQIVVTVPRSQSAL